MSVLKIKDENGNIIEIPAFKGEKGDSYTLTESDKQEIAELVSSTAIGDIEALLGGI